MFRQSASVLVGFGSGVVVAGAVFAFITAIGVVPRLAQKTRTQRYTKVYESSLIIGGVFGAAAGIWTFRLPMLPPFVIILSLLNGIFFGALAMSLAEVLNVIPIFTRRGRIQRGLFFLILAIALGKTVGSLLYFLLPGFFDTGQM